MRIAIVVQILLGSGFLLQASDLPMHSDEKAAFQANCAGNANATKCAVYKVRVLEAQEKKLYEQEKEKLSKFPDKQLRLKTSEEAWSDYVAAECHFHIGSGIGNGTGFLERYSSCVSERIPDRIEQLEKDVSCAHDGCWPQ